MKSSIDGLLPSMTAGFINKVLLVDVYFLLSAGQSPAYFTLPDFLDGYSMELLYIAVLLSLLTGWLFIPALAGYTIFVGGLTWFVRKLFGLIRCQGIPIFRALDQQNQENSVSLLVAKDYAKSKKDSELKARIEEHEKKMGSNLQMKLWLRQISFWSL